MPMNMKMMELAAKESWTDRDLLEYHRLVLPRSKKSKQGLEQCLVDIQVAVLVSPNESRWWGAVKSVLSSDFAPETLTRVCNSLLDVVAAGRPPFSKQACKSLVAIGKPAVKPILTKLTGSPSESLQSMFGGVLRAISVDMAPKERSELGAALTSLQRRSSDVGLQRAIGETLVAFRDADSTRCASMAS
jgi:hypothetical protein